MPAEKGAPVPAAIWIVAALGGVAGVVTGLKGGGGAFALVDGLINFAIWFAIGLAVWWVVRKVRGQPSA